MRPRLEEGVLHLVEDAPVFRRPIFIVHLEGVDNPLFHTAVEGLRRAAREEMGDDDEG